MSVVWRRWRGSDGETYDQRSVGVIELDLNGRRISLSEDEARWVIARGAAQAGVSSQRRDLAAIFRRALAADQGATRVVVLRRFEARTLETLLNERTAAA